MNTVKIGQTKVGDQEFNLMVKKGCKRCFERGYIGWIRKSNDPDEATAKEEKGKRIPCRCQTLEPIKKVEKK